MFRFAPKKIVLFSIFNIFFFSTSLFAGNLDPPGSPAPTMKSLDQVPPTWDQVISGPGRFQPAIGGVAALDKETGLVWNKIAQNFNVTWEQAINHCYKTAVGNRLGWRLPTLEELVSLVDPTQSTPMLPAGHPFNHSGGGNFGLFWTATVDPVDDTKAYQANIDNGGVGSTLKTQPASVWCVRGGGKGVK